jgi:hypothetical protein
VVKHAVVSSEDTHATACSVYPFRVDPYPCGTWVSAFSPEAEALFAGKGGAPHQQNDEL